MQSQSSEMHQDIRSGFVGLDDKLNEVASSLKQMQSALDAFQRATSSMLSAMLTGEHSCPRYVCMLPAKVAYSCNSY